MDKIEETEYDVQISGTTQRLTETEDADKNILTQVPSADVFFISPMCC